MDGATTINHALVKGVSVFGVFVTIDLWTDLGKVCGATFSMLLMAEWLWKKVLRPLAFRFGLIKTPSVIIRDGE